MSTVCFQLIPEFSNYRYVYIKPIEIIYLRFANLKYFEPFKVKISKNSVLSIVAFSKFATTSMTSQIHKAQQQLYNPKQ